MSDKIKNDGAAFPIIRHLVGTLGEQRTEILEHGLTKRELFAAMAMEGILAGWSERGEAEFDPFVVAARARGSADALLAELEKGNP